MSENSRQDSLDRYYNSIKILNTISAVLFWVAAFFSISLLYLKGYPVLTSWTNIMFVVVTILYFILKNYNTIFLMLDGENRRRRHLVSQSFGVPLDTEFTQSYYNNSEVASIRKLAVNTFENTLLTHEITSVMVRRERFKVLGYFIIWILLLLNRESSLEVLAIVAQVAFSSSLVTNWVKVEILNNGTERIKESLYSLFLQLNGNETLNNINTALFIKLVMEYECLKISVGINLSTKVFNKINPVASNRWRDIKETLKIKN